MGLYKIVEVAKATCAASDGQNGQNGQNSVKHGQSPYVKTTLSRGASLYVP